MGEWAEKVRAAVARRAQAPGKNFLTEDRDFPEKPATGTAKTAGTPSIEPGKVGYDSFGKGSSGTFPENEGAKEKIFPPGGASIARAEIAPGDPARDAFDERAAILEHDAGLPRAEAERLAMEMARRDGDTLARWRAGIEAVAADAYPWDTLRKASLAFLDGPHAAEAVRFAWTERDLWGVWAWEAEAITIRVDALGLVPMMALSVFGYRLVSLGAGAAVLETRTGTRHTFRAAVLPRPAVVWWRHQAVRA